jgi:vitamin B12 transporter
MQRHCLAAGACGLVFTLTASAAPTARVESELLEEIVVTASRLRQPLSQTLRHTTVLTEGDIRASAAPDLPTLLRQQAGIEIAQSGGLGTQSSLFLRGANSNQTLVLLDGMRIDSATTGATAIDQIMLADIERIEVVRGNVSAIYGANAIGGVVQIFTKLGAGTPAGRFQAGMGSYGSRSIQASHGGQVGTTRYHLGIAHLDRDGFSAARAEFIPTPFVFAPGDRDRDGYRNTTFTLNLTHEWRPGHGLSLLARASRGEVEYDGTFSNRSEQDLDALQLVSENRITDVWSSRLQLGSSRDSLDSFLDGTPASRVHTRNRQVDWLNTVHIAPGQDLTLGLGLVNQRVSSDMTYTRNRREIKHAALGYLAEIDRHGLQLNARYDDYSDFGTHTTGSVGYAYAFLPGWRFIANAGTAFRAPTFNDLYNTAWGGNPNLRPEKARNVEAGLQYAKGSLSSRVMRFQSRTKDLIVYQWPGGNVNVGRAEVDGWEGSLAARLAGFDLDLGLTWQDPRNADTGARLLRRAQRLGSLQVRRAFGPASISAEVKASGSRGDIHATTFSSVRLPGYTVVNLSGEYRFNPSMQARLRIDNVFDRDYSLVHGYHTPGRSGMLQFEWTF